MNSFTISHLSPMFSSPSLPPPLSTAGASSAAISAPTGGACSGLIPRLDIWLGRSASWAHSLKIKTRGGAESSSVVSKRKKFGRRAVLTSDMGAEEEVGSRPLLQVQSGEELLLYIRRKVESGKLSPDVGHKLEELYYNYQNAILQSGNPNAHEVIRANMAVAFDRMLLDAEDPFIFPPLHKAIREPFDYYKFGQHYIRPLVDFRNSYVGNIHLFQEMEQKLEQGHNIILMSNHQTEADPAVIALLLERDCPRIAENIFFIAGDRVVTDLLCKPFSMGRNLICVYSKKHMYDEPELVEMKRRANTRSLKDMALLLRGGSQIIWIAPSGGRDRPDPITGEWHPAPFDASSIDNMRRLAEHCHTPAHIYPLALLCYEIMPPPRQVEKQIGERREISFHGVGLSTGPEMNFQQVTSHCKETEEGYLSFFLRKHAISSFSVGLDVGKEVFSQALYESVTRQYNALKSAIYGNKGLGASSDSITLSQPWQP